MKSWQPHYTTANSLLLILINHVASSQLLLPSFLLSSFLLSPSSPSPIDSLRPSPPPPPHVVPRSSSRTFSWLTKPDGPPPANHYPPMKLQSGDEPSSCSLLFLTTVTHTHWQSCDGHIVQLSQFSVQSEPNAAAAAAAARRVSRANRNALPRPMHRIKPTLPALFCIGIISFLLWVVKVRLEYFKKNIICVLWWCVEGCSVRLGAICCSRLGENMFTLRTPTHALCMQPPGKAVCTGCDYKGYDFF